MKPATLPRPDFNIHRDIPQSRMPSSAFLTCPALTVQTPLPVQSSEAVTGAQRSARLAQNHLGISIFHRFRLSKARLVG